MLRKIAIDYIISAVYIVGILAVGLASRGQQELAERTIPPKVE